MWYEDQFMEDITDEDEDEEMTGEETEADRIRIEKMTRYVIALLRTKPERGVVKTIDCPMCEGKKTLSVTRSKATGHVRAACSSCTTSLMS